MRDSVGASMLMYVNGHIVIYLLSAAFVLVSVLIVPNLLRLSFNYLKVHISHLCVAERPRFNPTSPD